MWAKILLTVLCLSMIAVAAHFNRRENERCWRQVRTMGHVCG